jgi:PAS domain S-box-containing protein
MNSETESLFKSLTDNSPDIIAILNKDLTYNYINPAITKYTGLHPDEIIGRDIYFSYQSEENVRMMLSQIKNAVERKEVTELELRVNTIEGPRCFNIKISVVFYETDDVKNIFIMSRDITDLKLNSIELENKQKYIVTSAEALLQPFVILIPVYEGEDLTDFNYDYVNEAATVSNGMTREVMLRETVLNLFPLHRENGVFESLKKVFLTSEPWRDTVYYYYPAGSSKLQRIFEISAARVDNRLVATWNDITALKITEERLKRSEKKFNLAFSNSPAAMVLSRISGEIVDFNKAFEEMFGYSGEELSGKRSIDIGFFIDPRDREILIRILKRDGIIKNQEFQLKNRAQEILKTEISVVQLEIDEEIYLLSVIMDVTDQRRLEKSLQDSLKEKVILLQEVHHRVRNNMQIILSMLNLQRNSVTDYLLNDQLLSAQNRIRSMALVYDKLFPSDSYSSINLQQYLSTLVSESSESLFSPEVQLESLLPGDFTIDIESAIKIGLIVNELFSNSIKHAFTEISQGRITIRIEQKENHYLLLQYSDNGAGLPDILTIHKPGSLGLRLINILVDDLNGTIEYSRMSDCTRFDIKIKAG